MKALKDFFCETEGIPKRGRRHLLVASTSMISSTVAYSGIRVTSEFMRLQQIPDSMVALKMLSTNLVSFGDGLIYSAIAGFGLYLLFTGLACMRGKERSVSIKPQVAAAAGFLTGVAAEVSFAMIVPRAVVDPIDILAIGLGAVLYYSIHKGLADYNKRHSKQYLEGRSNIPS